MFLFLDFEQMAERNMNVIELKGFSASVMEILLNSIYGEPLILTNDNVQDILPAASLLQLNATGSTRLRFNFNRFTMIVSLDIQRQCAQFLASNLDPTNGLGIYCFADLHNCSQLKHAGLRNCLHVKSITYLFLVSSFILYLVEFCSHHP